MIQARFNKMGENLAARKELNTFRMVKDLVESNGIPPRRTATGELTLDHNEISDMMATQHGEGEEMEKEEEEVDIDIEMDDLRKALKSSPTTRNTARDIDKMSYRFLRFWFRKHCDKMLILVKEWFKHGCRGWQRAETVLIKKGDKV